MKSLSRIMVVVGIVLVGVVLLSPRGYTAGGGKDIFLAKSCNNCHSVTSQGIQKKGEGETKPVDLSKAAVGHDVKWLTGWMNKEESLNGKKHRKTWKGTDDELASLVKWLASLK